MKRFLSLLLCFTILVGVSVTGAAADTDKTDDVPLTAVYAASDFQAHGFVGDNVERGKQIMQTIIREMVADGYEIESALVCGDYSNVGNTWESINVELNNTGLAAVAEILRDELTLDYDDVIYVQGNHDPADTVGLDAGGANDTEYYGVFVLHEDDFQWKQGADVSIAVTNSGNDENDAEEMTKAAAEALRGYLQAKVDARYSRPIFVCAHVPLHYSYRTFSVSRQDNIYAQYIFDALNEYGRQLNIIYLFGHDHSGTYDDYLGGGSIYLPVGEKILIPDKDEEAVYKEHSLNFTYMNAGYVGYYKGNCEGGLTSSVFEIYEDRVVVARYCYDSNEKTASVAKLKAAGVWDSGHKYNDFTEKVNNTTVYESGQTIPLKKFFEGVETGDFVNGANGVFGIAIPLIVCTGMALLRGVRKRRSHYR